MSIKILSPEEIKKGVSEQQPALLFPNYNNLYSHRRERLEQLAQNHPFANYLTFIAGLVATQQIVLRENPLENMPELNAQQLAHQPLNCRTWLRDEHWLKLLSALLEKMAVNANEDLQATIEWLQKASNSELNQLADKLLNEEFSEVGSDKALFIWSALSIYWRQMANKIPHQSVLENGDNLTRCPVCNSAPTASVVHLGEQQGLRYLHCALCETEWNMVRAKCSNCDQMGKLSYFMLNDEFAAVRAETCDDCESYLKILFQEKAPEMDVMADDLASLFLDVEMEEKGYARSGLNPYLFADED